jgi:hypothetical protein
MRFKRWAQVAFYGTLALLCLEILVRRWFMNQITAQVPVEIVYATLAVNAWVLARAAFDLKKGN